MTLACTAHPPGADERCRLKQQNHPLRRTNSAAFWRKELETVWFDSLILKQALEPTRSVGSRAS